MKCLTHLISLVFPEQCLYCGRVLSKSEKHLCCICFSDLPFTHYFNVNENPVQKLFWGRIQLDFAASMLQFENGNITQHILHNLKYRNRPDLGKTMGKIMAHEILNSSWLKDIHGIVPVPLHSKKIKKRGYNQSRCLAQGIAGIIDVPIFDQMIRKVENTSSQTKKKRFDRWRNVKRSFRLKSPNVEKGKHIVIVDDVITTGATIEACAQLLIDSGYKVSAISLARTT